MEMMEFEFYQELLLTAVFSVLIFFLIGKIAVIGASDGELTDDVSVSADLAESDSAREKSEGSESKETEATADRSGTEEELVVVAEEKSFVGTDIMKVQEGERHEVGTEIKIERGSECDVEEEDGSLLHGEDEWEGIEKSEVEKLFAVTTNYVRSSSGAAALARVSIDVQMQLYGLNKIATEGPCYEPQPLPLNFSARAKWQAWQRLGNMTPEVAMEHYISLLSKHIPGWMDASCGEEAMCDRGNDSPVEGKSDSGPPDLRLPLQRQLSSKTQRKSEELAPVEIDQSTEGSKILEQGFTSSFILNLLSPIYW